PVIRTMIKMGNLLNSLFVIVDHYFTLEACTFLLWKHAENIKVFGTVLVMDGQLSCTLGNERGIVATNTNYSMSKLVSFAGRLNYAYKGKYLLTATCRTDGSSILAQGRQWAFFPSVAAAWRILDENFMADQNTFSELKLRASYEKAGNYAVDPYSTQ